MERDSVRTSDDCTLVDLWIDGKLRAVVVPRDAIDSLDQLPLGRSAAMTEAECREFVRTHLAVVLKAATDRLRSGDRGADLIRLGAAEGAARVVDRRRGGDRRRGDRRAMPRS